ASIWIIVGLGLVAIMCLFAMVARLFRKAGPHEALVVYGFRKTRVVIGAGTVIFPMIESFKLLSLELMSFDVAPQQDLYTNQGVAVTVEAVAQLKVKSDDARIKRDADVASAEADRDTTIKKAEAQRASAIARAQADQERVLAETLSLAKQSEAQRDLEIKKAQYLETVKRQQAQADKAYELQQNITQQQVVAEQVKIQQIEKEQQIKVQEAEIMRHEKELIATVLKQAEIERQRVMNIAEGEKGRLIAQAE